MTWRRRIEVIGGILTAALGGAGLVVALFAPLATESGGCTTTGGISQPPVVDCSQAFTRHVSVIETQGIVSLLPAILIFGTIFVAIAGFALVHSRSGASSARVFLWIFTGLLWVMMVLGALSIGMFFVPAGILAIISRARGSLPFLWVSALLLAAATTVALLPRFVLVPPPRLPDGLLFLPSVVLGVTTAALGTFAARERQRAAT